MDGRAHEGRAGMLAPNLEQGRFRLDAPGSSAREGRDLRELEVLYQRRGASPIVAISDLRSPFDLLDVDEPDPKPAKGKRAAVVEVSQ